jgi:hypothetical protein
MISTGGYVILFPFTAHKRAVVTSVVFDAVVTVTTIYLADSVESVFEPFVHNMNWLELDYIFLLNVVRLRDEQDRRFIYDVILIR